jgi:hypothetical protein
MNPELEQLIAKAREVRSLLLLSGDAHEVDAKRFVGILELTEKLVVFRELAIQGKAALSSRLADFLKAESYRQLKETLEACRGMMDSSSSPQRVLTSGSLAVTEKSALRLRLASLLEDLILSA